MMKVKFNTDLILSPVVQYLFNKLTSNIENAINLYLQKKENRKELPKTIENWKKQLRDIAEVLSDAEQKRSRDESIEEWLKDLQDWAYDLEDLLDEFATDARLNECYPESHEEEDDSPPFCKFFHLPVWCNCILHIKVWVSFLPCVSRASDLNNDAYVTRIEEISNRLDAILRRVETLGLVKQKPSREERQQEQRVETTCIAPRVFGRTKEKQLIINRLLVDESYNHENYAVIPIVGKGGVGKTTLIQSVYNDEKLNGRFEVTAWVCASNAFDIQNITTNIIRSADASSAFNNLNEAQNKLRGILRGKRFLIVLDDVWNDEYDPWEQLQRPFQEGLKGSKVMVTTRLESVARNMLTTRDQNSIVHVDGLSNEECWLIFEEHALETFKNDPVVIETRDEVIKLCKGLPLAAKALGGLLKKHTRSNWSTILSSSSGIWREEGGVLPALRLSYYHLPQHLKRVFAYCSVFPQDHEFLKEDLVLMWMAEGFLPESEEESMEDKGNSYFDDLVSRSLFESFFGDYFIMHDLINDLAQWAAGGVCCRMKIKKKIPSRTRYLSVTREVSDQDPSFLENVGDAGRQLRTYVHLSRLSLRSTVLESSLFQFQCLRVLYLANMGFTTELPDSIGNLKHLRFLDLSLNFKLKHLPGSMSKLCNLQTLLLENCGFEKWFNMEFLIELRHLKFDSNKLEMPLEIGKLINLRTLLPPQFKLGLISGHRIRDLENLKYLSGSLDIDGVQFVKREDAKMARLHEKSHLEKLTFHFSENISRHDYLDRVSNLLKIPNFSEEMFLYGKSEFEDLRRRFSGDDYSLERGVLNELQPPNSIKELSLYDYMASAFPAWLGDPSFNKMVVIKLVDCSRCECLPPLGQLPSLKKLKLKNMDGIKTVGPEFYGTGCINPFPALKTIKFSDLKNWDAWVHPSGENSSRAFPFLKEIEIYRCRLLQGNFIPSNLPSLKKLDIMGSPEMKISLPRCPKLQELIIKRCRELSSIKPVICCSRIVHLESISSFSGVEGFRVPDVACISVIDTFHNTDPFDKSQPRPPRILSNRCPRFKIYGKLHKLTHVRVSNCELLDLWFQKKSLPSVEHLEIVTNPGFLIEVVPTVRKILNDVSTVTKPFTCLESLEIRYCKALRITANNYMPLTLRKLILIGVEIEQPAKEWGLDRLLTSLEHLEIESLYRQDSCLDAVELIPDDLPLPSSLVTIRIRDFKNLKSFSCSTLHNLSELAIYWSPLMSKECVYVDGGQCKLQRLRVN